MSIETFYLLSSHWKLPVMTTVLCTSSSMSPRRRLYKVSLRRLRSEEGAQCVELDAVIGDWLLRRHGVHGRESLCSL